jgi:hypothetical protein
VRARGEHSGRESGRGDQKGSPSRSAAQLALVIGLVALGAVYVACLGFGVQTTGDYGPDFAPAMTALLSGHLHAFFANLPVDGAGGSLLLRAPAGLLVKALGGGRLAVFRAGAFVCVLALGALGLALAAGMRRRGAPVLGRAALVGLLLLAPLLLGAVLFGHPEEALGAALCVAAVLLAGDRRPALAGVALGLAVVNKPWGALAAVPTLLVASRQERIRLTACAAAVAGPWFAATALVDPSAFSRELHAVWPVAHPADLWWPLATPSTAPGGLHEYLAPAFLQSHGRELIVLVPVLAMLVLAPLGDRSTERCLALLAVAFLLRCMVDPSNHVYYHVPLIVAIAAYEARTRSAPVLALLATGLVWLVFHTVSGIASLNVQFAAYMAVALALGAALVAELLPRRDWLGRAAIVRHP